MQRIPVGDFWIGEGEPLAVMSGPCVIESEEHCLRTAETLKKLLGDLKLNFIFKASYDKANRSAKDSFRGPGLQEGLRILERVKKELDLPILTDIHTPEDARAVGQVCDIVQIPAFLCRQTDLVFAAADSGAVINVKKGQFLAPWDMLNIVEKIQSRGHHKIILTDRGTSFGYNNLVSDMRSIPVMKKFGYPVCFDASHSAQLPGGLGTSTGGQREFIPHLAKAAVAAGCNCLFIESHENPAAAKSDSATVFDIQALPGLLKQVKAIYEVCRE